MIDYYQICNDNHFFFKFIDQLIDYLINCASLRWKDDNERLSGL